MNISAKKDTRKDKNINISSLKYDFKNLRHNFELINIEVQCSKKQFKIFLQLEAGALGKNAGKEPQKPHPKLKNMYIIYLLRMFALPAVQCKW